MTEFNASVAAEGMSNYWGKTLRPETAIDRAEEYRDKSYSQGRESDGAFWAEVLVLVRLKATDY